ncbi:MAG: hypothetical protein QOI04_2278 [Verrucomicrobiota bacterium]|jgi:hypothetical protein
MNFERTITSAPQVEATYKSRDVEGLIDIYFYRKVGFFLARIFARLKWTPDAVTILGALIGVLAGHLYFYRELAINIAGMVLHVFANALDNADGQLARILQQRSRAGRSLDGICDAVVFASVYVNLSLRYVAEGGSPLIGLLAFAAGYCHSLQSSVADYFRNGYIFFTSRGTSGELDSSEALRKNVRGLSWRREPLQKFLLAAFYVNYTRQQERLAPPQAHLLTAINARGGVSSWLAQEYRRQNRHMTKWFNFLTVNTRMLILFALLLIGKPIWYLFVELTVFNAVLGFVLVRQNRMSREIGAELERQPS